ncbi:MAG: outer membrane protein assembly factor BamD, partial [Myxococcota bacterium]|nr:outer membrane protein assembly factor BamD [Myxococcota bacterium]
MRQSRRPLVKVTRSAIVATLTLLISTSGIATAQTTNQKALKGKDAFSLERFEESLFDERAKVIQAKMSKIRRKKIKTLEKIVNSNRPYQNKADVLFRLAEAYWKESQYKYLLARDEYDKAYDCFEEKRCTAEPKEPQEDFKVSLEIYRQILREHPTYKRIDEILYYLGRAALKAGKAKRDVQLQKEAVKRLNDLTQKYPRSKFLARSHLALGEYFFETDSLFYAKQNYEKIINNFPRSPMYNYALYKLGWVYFNLVEFEKAVKTFKTVIASISGGKSRGVIEFRSQALNDLIVAYAEIEGGWRLARDYFLREVGEPDTYVKLEKMAGLLVSQDKDEEGIDLYNHLIAHDKSSPKVVEFYDALLEINRKLEDMTTIEAVINEFVVFLDPKGAWYIANRADASLAKRADELRSTNLAFLANHYHRGAQKQEKERKPSVANFGKAAHYYKMYLDRFPDHKISYMMNFYYAEILYDQLDQHEKAAVQYEAVLEKDRKGEFVEDAALGVIYAVERMLVSEGLRENVSEGVKYEAKKKEVDLRGNDLEIIPRTDLHSLEQRYVNAADKYVSVMSDNLRDPAFRKKYPKRGKMIPTIMFIAAQTFYGHGQFAEAVNRLMVIFDLYPEDKMANVAVTTII